MEKYANKGKRTRIKKKYSNSFWPHDIEIKNSTAISDLLNCSPCYIPTFFFVSFSFSILCFTTKLPMAVVELSCHLNSFGNMNTIDFHAFLPYSVEYIYSVYIFWKTPSTLHSLLSSFAFNSLVSVSPFIYLTTKKIIYLLLHVDTFFLMLLFFIFSSHTHTMYIVKSKHKEVKHSRVSKGKR